MMLIVSICLHVTVQKLLTIVVRMSSVTFQFKGKTALVTGAGQGNSFFAVHFERLLALLSREIVTMVLSIYDMIFSHNLMGLP